MKQNDSAFIRNAFGVSVKKCCASCAFKVLDNSRRLCKKGEGSVPSNWLCEDWDMAEGLKKAGRGGGNIKKKEYLYNVLKRQEEDDELFAKAAQKGLAYRRTPITEIRAAFTKGGKSLYSIRSNG